MVKIQKTVTDLGQFGYALTGYFYFSMATAKQLACLKHKLRSHLSVTKYCFQNFYLPLHFHNIFLQYLIRISKQVT